MSAVPIATGAAAGAMFGPIGMAAGAAVGLIQGFLGSQAQAKQNDALAAQMRQYQVQQGNMNVAYKTQTGMINEDLAFQTEGIMQNAAVQRLALQRQYQAQSGSALAATAESGFALSGSKRNILESIDNDAIINRRIVDSNISRSLQQSALEYRSQLFAAQQQKMANQFQNQNQMTALRNQQASPFLSGLTAGIGGFGTGISIASAFSDRSITTVDQGGRA